MIVTDLSVKKVDHNDPIYPDLIEGRPFTDVFLLTATLADGSEQACSFFVFKEMTPDHAATMLKVFAKALGGIQTNQAA